MTVMNLRRLHIPVIKPFLNLPALPIWVGARRPRAVTSFPGNPIDTKNFRRLYAVGKQISQNLHIHRWTAQMLTLLYG